MLFGIWLCLHRLFQIDTDAVRLAEVVFRRLVFWPVSFSEATIIALGGPPTGVLGSNFSTDYISLLLIDFSLYFYCSSVSGSVCIDYFRLAQMLSALRKLVFLAVSFSKQQ